MKQTTLKRLLSMVLVLAMVLSFMPSVTIWEAKAADVETKATTSNRTTIYFSTSGSDWNAGTSESRPKKDITKIPSYLKQGYNVMLKRGDIWYLPTGSLSLKDIAGTEDNPVVFGCYGDESKPLPTIAFLKQIADNKWTLVDAEKNIYKTDVSDMTSRVLSATNEDTKIRVHRLFVNDEAFCHRSITDYTLLNEEEYFDYDGTLYVRTSGGAPTGVEVTPYAGSGVRLQITRAEHLTIENIHFKGASAINPVIRINAPTSYVKMLGCNITHCFYYILEILANGDTTDTNYKPEIANCYIDANFSEAEGWASGYDSGHWTVHITEGITMRDSVDGAWIHHNTIRNMSHAAIAIESLSRDTYYNTLGVRNCIIEDNILEAGNAKYSRAFNICGGYNQSGQQMCYNNIYRRNKCYDMSTSSHLYGENNLIYSNLFSYTHCNYLEDGSLFDGKGAQPWGFDSIPWNDHTSIGNMVVNNTFYDVGGGLALNDIQYSESRIYNNIYANNLIVNYDGENEEYPGGFYDSTSGINYVMNNGVYAAGMNQDYYVNGKVYRGEEVNQVLGYSGNISAAPGFATADLGITGVFKRQDFALSGNSPYCYAGLALDSEVYKQFPMYAKLVQEYTDINGNPYDPKIPSIGAYSYSETYTKPDIQQVLTQITPVAIIAGYPDYLGSSWKEALGHQEVSVQTSDGKTANVMVNWDYSPLGDCSVLGKYVITGTLVSNVCNNPRNITVQRVIYIREKTGNLFTNGTFDSNYDTWYTSHAPTIKNGALQLTLKDNDNTQWNVMYSQNYNSSSNTKNQAKLLADKVNALGAGQYFISYDVAWTKVAQDASYLGVSMQLHSYNAYNQGLAFRHLQGEAKTHMLPSGGSDFHTYSNVVDLNGTDAYLRTSIVFYSKGQYLGQEVQLDNLQLFPLKLELKDVPADLQQPNFSNVTAIRLGFDTMLTFQVPVKSFGSTYTNPYVVVNYKGTNYKITDYDTENGEYVFDLLDVAPYPLDSAVTATLFYTYNGTTICSDPYIYYAKDFCEDNGHNYEAQKTVNPTCTTAGSIDYVCSACGDSYTETLAATGHKAGAAVQENVKNATCVASGSYDSVVCCESCGVELSRNTISTNPTGEHTFDNVSDMDCNVCGFVRELEQILSILDLEKFQPIAIVSGYDKYVSDWQAGLALPKEATVLTSEGRTVIVPIVWDYTPLGDLTTVGGYVLTGTLNAAELANPNGITAKNIVYIRSYENLLHNPSFELGSNGSEGWGGSGSTAKNTTAAHISHGAASLLKNITSTNAGSSYQLAYQYNHNMDPLKTKNYSVMLADAVKEKGAGTYYLSVEAKSAFETLDNSYKFYILLRGKDVYNGTSVSIAETPRTTLPISGSGFSTSALILNLDTNYNWLRTDIYLSGAANTLTGQKLYLDNAQLVCIRQVLSGCDHNVVDGICTVCGHYGTCGENVFWSYDGAGTLTISGNGAMADYTGYDKAPWAGIREEITTLIIESGVTQIGTYAFNSMYNLTSVTIPDTVEGVGSYAFEYSSNLNSVYITDLKAWCEITFGNNSSNPLFYADNLYINNTLVTELVVPEGTTHIGAYAFYDYDGFTSVTIPGSVVSIGEKAFYGCTKLTKVNIAEGLTTIGSYAFASSKVAQVLLPKTLTTIANNAFNSCSSLKDVFYRSTAADLSAVEIGANNTKVTGAAIVYNFAGDTTPEACTHSWVDATCETPKTCALCGAVTGSALDHSYNEVVTSPTCAAVGYTTHTCTVCGDSYKDSETPATGEHTYDNDQDADCNVCGATREVGPTADAALKFMSTPSLSFQDYIGMQVMMTKKLANKYDKVYVEAVQVTPEGTVTTVLEPILYMTNYYVFDQQIMAWSMTEVVTLTLYAEKDGKTLVGQSYTASVESLALGMLEKYATNDKVCRMLVDMLNYGAAVQTQFNYNAANLPNTKLGAFADRGTAEIPVCDATNSKTGTATVKVLNDSVSMQAKVEIQLVIKGAVKDTPKATIGTKVLNPVLDTTSIKGYTVIRVAIAATDLRETVTIALYDANGNPVTQVYNVSVEGYAVTAITGSQSSVVIAMMRYGDSVKAYATK